MTKSDIKIKHQRMKLKKKQINSITNLRPNTLYLKE